MIRTLLFLHILGFVLWIGGAYAIMIASIASRKEERSALAPIVRIQAAIYGSVVGPGAGVAVISGLVLTFKMFGPDAAPPSVWLIVMQVTGLLAGIVMLAFVIPTAGRLRRLDPVGASAAAFDALRQRQRVTGMVSGVLVLVALVAGVLTR
jgi:uncharacterized membrane protein